MKVILTTSEILVKFGLPSDTELIIENSKSVDGSTKEDSDGWISNIGRDREYHPESLSPDAQIEVKYRIGFTDTGRASQWDVSWCEVSCCRESYDIVAYRILKD